MPPARHPGVRCVDITSLCKAWRGAVMSAAWSPDGNWLASAGGGREGGQLFVWEAQSGEHHPAWGAGNSALAGHPGAFSSVAWNPSGELLIGGAVTAGCAGGRLTAGA